MDEFQEDHVLVLPEVVSEEKVHNVIDENLWRSCCLITDRRMIVFFSQLIIALAVISFSFVQLIRNDQCESNQLYVGLVTMIIGIFLPSPRVK
jgi:hypothetical protein